MRAARAGKVDLIGSVGKTPEREGFLAFTEPYVKIPSVVITRKDQLNISGIASLRSRTVAVEAGFFAHEALKRRHPEIKLLEVRTTPEALEAVALGKADAYVGNLIVSTYLIDKNYMTNLEVRSPVDFIRGDLHFAVRKQLPELPGILDAGLESLSEGERRTIRQRWVPVADRLSETHGVELTTAERAWIARHPRIRVGVDPAWEPLDFFDKAGRHSGLASDYLKLMRERIGLNLEVMPGANWADTLERAQRRELDMIALITQTPGAGKGLPVHQALRGYPDDPGHAQRCEFRGRSEHARRQTVAVLKDYFAGRLSGGQVSEDPCNGRLRRWTNSSSAVSRGYAFATVGSVATLGPKHPEAVSRKAQDRGFAGQAAGNAHGVCAPTGRNWLRCWTRDSLPLPRTSTRRCARNGWRSASSTDSTGAEWRRSPCRSRWRSWHRACGHRRRQPPPEAPGRGNRAQGRGTEGPARVPANADGHDPESHPVQGRRRARLRMQPRLSRKHSALSARICSAARRWKLASFSPGSCGKSCTMTTSHC